jgi:hypothetical protein
MPLELKINKIIKWDLCTCISNPECVGTFDDLIPTGERLIRFMGDNKDIAIIKFKDAEEFNDFKEGLNESS